MSDPDYEARRAALGTLGALNENMTIHDVNVIVATSQVHALMHIGDQLARIADTLKPQVELSERTPWAVGDLVWHSPGYPWASVLAQLDHPADKEGWWYAIVLHARGEGNEVRGAPMPGHKIRLDEGNTDNRLASLTPQE